jgi:AcrR family transcriptional regulator
MQTAERSVSDASAILLAGAGRRASILKDASDVLAGSSSITNIETLVSAAGVSTSDIVDEFGDEDGLAIALAEMIAGAMIEPLEDCAPATSFQQRLCAFGRRVTDASLVSQFQRLCRIAIAGTSGKSGLVAELYRRGPAMVTAELARFFDEEQVAGLIKRADSHQLANHFMALLTAGYDLPDGVPFDRSNVPPSPRDLSQITELFCAGVQTEANDACTAV